MEFRNNMIVPTPDEVIAFLRHEQTNISLTDYTDALYDRYIDARIVRPIRFIRNQMIHIPEIASDKSENRAKRTSFMASYVLGIHGSRYLLQNSTIRRVGMNQVLEDFLDTARDSVSPIADDDQRRSAFVTETLGIASRLYDDMDEYHSYFESIKHQFSPIDEAQSFAQLGFGLAVGISIVTRDAEIDE